jgi:glycosyltransferase involved in cell wall biosynthesis
MKLYFHKQLVKIGGAEKVFLEQCQAIGEKDIIRVVGFVDKNLFETDHIDKILVSEPTAFLRLKILLKLMYLAFNMRVCSIICGSGIIDAFIVSQLLRTRLIYEDHHPIGMQINGTLFNDPIIYDRLKKFDIMNPLFKKKILKQGVGHFFKNTILRTLYVKSEKICVHSDYSKDEKMALFNRHTDVVPFLPSDVMSHHKREVPKAKNSFNIVYFGRIVEQKNIDILIRAVTKVSSDKNWELNILGASDPKYVDYLLQLIKEYNGNNNINLIEDPSDDMFFKTIQMSDLFVNTEYVDVNITNIEALLLGLNILVPSISQIPKEMSGQGIFRYSHLNSEIISDEIETIMESKKMTTKEFDYKMTRQRYFDDRISYLFD